MIIYFDREPKYKFRKTVKLPSTLWPRLIGVNVIPGKPTEVEPVYVPFVSWLVGDRHVILEFHLWGDKPWIVLLATKRPFVYVTRGGGIQLQSRDYYED